MAADTDAFGSQTRGVRSRLGGYLYQCNVAALRLIDTLESRASGVLLERRYSSSDSFDDIKVIGPQEIHAYQVKWGMYSQEDLSWQMFAGRSSGEFEIFDFRSLLQFYSECSSTFPDRRLVLHVYSTRSPRAGDILGDLLQVASDPALLRFCDAKPDNVFSFDPEPVLQLLPSLNQDAMMALLPNLVIEVGQLQCPASYEIEQSLGHPMRERIISRLRFIGLAAPPNTLPLTSCYNRLIQLCMEMTIYGDPITASKIEQNLDIGLDRGTVPQDFPFDPSKAVRSPLNYLLSYHLTSERPPRIAVVVGEPGSGKSWALTSFARDWEEAGAPIHYCFERPQGDVFLVERVREETVIANLISEIRHHHPSLDCFKQTNYGATREQLERVLQSLAMSRGDGSPVPVVIDGLDHALRTLESHRGVTLETSVLHLLEELSVPSGICIVVGSQPVDFLEELQAAKQSELVVVPMPSLDEGQVREMLRNEAALPEDAEPATALVLGALERSQGLPLYVHYIATTVRDRGLRHAGEIRAYLHILPVSGYIEEYYQYLWANSSQVAHQLMLRLALLEFLVGQVLRVL